MLLRLPVVLFATLTSLSAHAAQGDDLDFQTVSIRFQPVGLATSEPACRLVFEIRRILLKGDETRHFISFTFIGGKPDGWVHAGKAALSNKEAERGGKLVFIVPEPEAVRLKVGDLPTVVYKHSATPGTFPRGNLLAIVPVASMLPHALAMADEEKVTINLKFPGKKEERAVQGSAILPPPFFNPVNDFSGCLRFLGLLETKPDDKPYPPADLVPEPQFKPD